MGFLLCKECKLHARPQDHAGNGPADGKIPFLQGSAYSRRRSCLQTGRTITGKGQKDRLIINPRPYGESSVNNPLDRKKPAMVSFVLAAFSLVLSPTFARAIQLL